MNITLMFDQFQRAEDYLYQDHNVSLYLETRALANIARNAVMRGSCNIGDWVHDLINERAYYDEKLDEFCFQGYDQKWHIWCLVDSRDCDLYETHNYPHHITFDREPTAMDLFRWVENQLSGAEGPMSFRWVDEKTAREAQPSHRDRAAEMMNY